MKTTHGQLLLILTLATCVGVGNGTAATKNKPARAAANTTTPYTWYDGDRVRRVWMSPSLIAEFNGADEPTRRALAASATPLDGKHPAMRLWRLKSGQTSKSRMTQLRREAPGSRVSPVLHDNPSASGRKRALPGNIIVHLDPQWDRARVDAWLTAKGLEVIRPLEIGPNIYLIKTGPGLESLEKANALYRSGEVLAAYPNWWKEVKHR